MLTLHDAAGNVFDSLIYTWSVSSKSRYRSSLESWAAVSAPLTPWFSEKALQYFSSLFLVSEKADPETLQEKDTYYQWLYRKRKDRYYDLKEQISAFGLSVNQAGIAYNKSNKSHVELVNGAEDFAWSLDAAPTALLSIIAVLADAEGKDEGSEWVSIELRSDEAADLSTLTIHAGSKKSILAWLLANSGQKVTLKWDFGFTNKPSCVTLQQGKYILDTFCYWQPKAWIWATQTGNLVETDILSGITDFDRMKYLRISLYTGEACGLFGDVLFSCTTVKPLMDEKTKAKYEKKILSLEKGYTKKQYQYTGLQERYKNTKTTLDAKRRKYYQQVKTVRSDYKLKLANANLEMKIWKNYGKLLQSHIKDMRYVVWQHSSMEMINALLEQNLDALDHRNDTAAIIINGRSFSLWELKKQYLFTTDPGVVMDHLIGISLDKILPQVWELRSQWLGVRYSQP